MNDHVRDDAALYALGALSETEAAAFANHIRGCAQCARAVGEAERDVALAASHEPQHHAPAALQGRVDRILHRRPVLQASGFALAAAFVIGLLPSLWLWGENRSMQDAIDAQGAAMDRLASAPHLTATFHAMPGGSTASVMYPRNGSWYVIVVRDVSKTLNVAWMHGGTQTLLGRAILHGNVAMLYLPKSHRMNQLALMDGARVVAEASLSYE